VTLPNGSTWEIRAANNNLHGGSYDFIFCDEVWNLEPEIVDNALRPSQIARKSPLLSMWSTAGDESSTVMIQLREQALADIDAGKTSLLYFAEWSMPQTYDGKTVNPMDETFWRWANPALGTTITIEALRANSKKDSFMRAHLNQWQSARGGWLENGAWDKCKTDEPYPTGGPSVLAIDSSVDDARFVGVQSTPVNGSAFVHVAFICETETDMWQKVMEIMEDPRVELAVTPSLEIHIPVQLQKRYQTVGYSELVKMTSIARTMIHEKRVMHMGQQLLSEHVARAVGVKTPAGFVVSSQKSAGPIELARMAIFSICLSTKPVQRTRAMLVVAK
jgi:phage terminase large subunit-like protein